MKNILKLLVLIVGPLWAQKDSIQVIIKPIMGSAKPLKFNLNEDGSLYFQTTFLNQTWLRFNESNPGTMVNGEKSDQTLDIGLRRTRIQMFGQITSRSFIYFQFGMNNFNSLSQNAGNRKLGAFFHDALCEYRLSTGNQLKIGGGLTIANGLSRFSQPSIGTIMTLDVPVFAQATVDQTDEFSRKLSIYARGQVGKFDYRFSYSDPFVYRTSGITPTAGVNASFAGKKHSKQYQTYIMYQFLEHESHTTPYMTGTYLGKKRIFNIAAGAIYQPKAMWHTRGQDTTYQQMLLLAVESFLDIPLNKDKETALSAYAGFFRYDFGINYLRYNGIMNPADGSINKGNFAANSQGNAYPMMGSGNVFYSQLGYLMPKQWLNKTQLMAFGSVMATHYDRIGQGAAVYELGMNWLIKGHQSKISLTWQNRPTFKQQNGLIKSDIRSSCLIAQYQIFI